MSGACGATGSALSGGDGVDESITVKRVRHALVVGRLDADGGGREQSLDRGEGVELTDELWDELMAEGDARAERGDAIDPLISGEF